MSKKRMLRGCTATGGSVRMGKRREASNVDQTATTLLSATMSATSLILGREKTAFQGRSEMGRRTLPRWRPVREEAAQTRLLAPRPSATATATLAFQIMEFAAARVEVDIKESFATLVQTRTRAIRRAKKCVRVKLIVMGKAMHPASNG